MASFYKDPARCDPFKRIVNGRGYLLILSKIENSYRSFLCDSCHQLIKTPKNAEKTGFSGLVRGNKTLGAILDFLKEEISEEELISAMLERFDGSQEDITKDVEKALSGLRSIGAIVE